MRLLVLLLGVIVVAGCSAANTAPPPMRGNGFSAVAEIMLRALLAGQRIAEVPMPLGERVYGESKLRLSDALLAQLHLILIARFGLRARFVRQTFSFRLFRGP